MRGPKVDAFFHLWRPRSRVGLLRICRSPFCKPNPMLERGTEAFGLGDLRFDPAEAHVRRHRAFLERAVRHCHGKHTENGRDVPGAVDRTKERQGSESYDDEDRYRRDSRPEALAQKLASLPMLLDCQPKPRRTKATGADLKIPAVVIAATPHVTRLCLEGR